MRHSEDRILTTHVGSLPRPKELIALAQRVRAGSAGETPAYEALLKSSVEQVVRQQAELGLDLISDGEFGKTSWSTYVQGRMTGYELRADDIRPLNWLGRDRERFPEFFAQEMPRAISGAPVVICNAPLEYVDTHPITRDISNFESALSEVSGVDGFMTSVAPASADHNAANEYYSSDREYVYALADAIRTEYKAIYAAGLLVQVDDAVLANMYDYLVEQSPEKYQEWAGLRVEALNHALQDIPEESIRYHVCYGSWHVPHVADAPLENIVDLILSVKAGAYSIEAANPRHEHEWRIWADKKLPNNRIVIPGVITHHTTTVEHPRVVADRIIRYAEGVGRENVIAGTDCGFAQGETTVRVHPSVMWAKFQALVEGAQIASKQLWA